MMQQRWLYQSCFYSCHCARTHALAPMWAAAVCDCVPLTTVRSLAGICIRQQPVFDSMESGHVQFLLILWFPFEKREREREREGEDLNEQFFVVYLYTSPSSWEFLSPVDILSFFFLSYRCIFAAYTFLWEEEEEEKKISPLFLILKKGGRRNVSESLKERSTTISFLFLNWWRGSLLWPKGQGGVTPPPPPPVMLLLLQWSFPLGWKPHHYTHSKERFLLFPIFCFLKERNCCWKFIWLRSPLILCVRKRRSRGEASLVAIYDLDSTQQLVCMQVGSCALYSDNIMKWEGKKTAAAVVVDWTFPTCRQCKFSNAATLIRIRMCCLEEKTAAAAAAAAGEEGGGGGVQRANGRNSRRFRVSLNFPPPLSRSFLTFSCCCCCCCMINQQRQFSRKKQNKRVELTRGNLFLTRCNTLSPKVEILYQKKGMGMRERPSVIRTRIKATIETMPRATSHLFRDSTQVPHYYYYCYLIQKL